MKLVALVACCLVLTACPPEGGELVPLAQEGAQLLTTKFSNDTISITREQVNIKAHGFWSIADSRTSVILDISNLNAEALMVDFNRFELQNSESKEKLTLRSVSDEAGASGPAFLSERAVTIGSQQARRFALEFKINSADGSSASVRRDVLGQTVILYIPLMLKGETPHGVDFVFTFKYAESKQ